MEPLPLLKYLHTMIRVTDPEATIRFFELIGLEEVDRHESPQGRFTLIFLAAPGQADKAQVELTYNWPPEDGSAPEASGRAQFRPSRFKSMIFTPPASGCRMPGTSSIARRATGIWRS